ncbi:GNAT family N-acetyltransferase [Exilibacterium tricleocarpae]|uniref:GNAT family N-acetyltransferase n=1 Tax=Exilibacterium tricleocarpae TaxID=2591008 RepID=UPI0015D43CE7|nr:GNAT family N-acetyltransferase [Exilibacterium tricleocarpae]
MIYYRPAKTTDAAAISKLILDTQSQFSVENFSPEGERLLAKVCSAEAIEGYLESGYIYFVAEDEATIVGVIGVRDRCHIEHNFVRGDYHRQGISSQLWRLAKESCLQQGNKGEFELRASTFAIPIYERWGFVKEGEKQSIGGIIFTPMRLKLGSLD